MLDQILGNNDGVQDCIIQITDVRRHRRAVCGYLQEGKRWAKYKIHILAQAMYADSTIAFSIVVAYVLATQKPRKPKRISKDLGKYYSKLQKDYLQNTKIGKIKIKRKH